MKHIELPPDVEMTDAMGVPLVGIDGCPRVTTMREFLIGRLTDAKMGESVEKVFQAMKIRALVLDIEGDTLTLEDADHEAILGVVKSPSSPYNAAMAHNFVGFMRAVVDATSKAPASPTSNSKKAARRKRRTG